MTDPKVIKVIGQRAYANRDEIRRDSSAVYTALDIARAWLSWHSATGEWPENVNHRTLDALLGAAEGAASNLNRQLAFAVGENDTDLAEGAADD